MPRACQKRLISESQTSGTVSGLTEPEFCSALQSDGIGLQIGPFTARVQVSVPGLTESLYRFYAHYPIVERESVYSFHTRLAPRRAFPRLYRKMVRFTVDGRKPHEDMPRAHALPVFEWGLNLVIALRSHCFLMLHSAVLERNDKAMLLPAMPGHGKTTLCAGLSYRGWRTLSDEFGLVRPGTLDMIPVPRPMALKNESIELVRSFAPAASIGPPTEGTRKGTVAHILPTVDSIVRQADLAPAKLIVFPRWEPGTTLSLDRLSKAESFMLLATNAFNYELLGEDGFVTVRDLVRAADCYRLVYSDLDEATHRLTELMDAHEG